MMRLQNRLGMGDSVVILVCMVLVIMALGAVGQSGRRRAKQFVCQANLRQWFGIFQGYIDQNGGKFISASPFDPYYWVRGLKDEDRDWKRQRLWFCPEADVPATDETGKPWSSKPSVFAAWGVYTIYSGPPSVAGSYGANGYMIPLFGGKYESGVYASQGWSDLRTVSNASTVPMFVDALRLDMWPLETNPPASDEFAIWTSNGMARCCINRHDGAVCCLFVDGSVRKVGLKELWTLKWHKSFNTAGPWTQAGGVGPECWPEWIMPFKDY